MNKLLKIINFGINILCIISALISIVIAIKACPIFVLFGGSTDTSIIISYLQKLCIAIIIISIYKIIVMKDRNELEVIIPYCVFAALPIVIIVLYYSQLPYIKYLTFSLVLVYSIFILIRLFDSLIINKKSTKRIAQYYFLVLLIPIIITKIYIYKYYPLISSVAECIFLPFEAILVSLVLNQSLKGKFKFEKIASIILFLNIMLSVGLMAINAEIVIVVSNILSSILVISIILSRISEK